MEFGPCAPRQLTAGTDRAAHGLRDRVEGDTEYVVQHEGDPFTGAEPAQYFEQRGADLVIEGDPVGRVEAARCRLVLDVAGALVPGAGRAHLVETEAARHHGQPAADVLDLVPVGARKPQEGLLRNIFRLADVSQHLVGEVDQIRAMATPGLVDLVAG